MLTIASDIEGKRAYYGEICQPFADEGFHICGNWEYYEAFFDRVLSSKEGVTLYLRLPAKVVEGKLDRSGAYLEFGSPFLIKHIVHIGLAENDFDFTVLDATGISQFQEPLDPDDYIERADHWRHAGEQALNRIKGYVH